MGGIYSCFGKRKEVKRVRNIQVQPVEDAVNDTNTTNYGVFCVNNPQSEKTTTTTGEDNKAGNSTDMILTTQTKPLASTEVAVDEGKDDSDSDQEIEIMCRPQKEEASKSIVIAVQEVSEENTKTMFIEEGLVTKRKGLSSKGLAFDIIEKQRGNVVGLPPARIKEMIKRKEKRREPTSEEIRQKLIEAERRRKQLSDERIVRVRAMKKTETAGAIKAFEEKQKALEDQQTKDMDDAVSSRQKHLCEIRDRLREKRRKAKLVRQIKDLNLDDMDPPPPEEPRLKFHHD